MKILFVSSGASFLGISPFIKSQGESLKEAGLQVDYFTIKNKGIRGYLKSVPLLRRQARGNRYDVLHAHYALSGWAAVLARPGIPIVISFMGGDVYGDVDERGRRTNLLTRLLSKLLQPFVRAIIVKSANLQRFVYRRNIATLLPNGVNFNRFFPMDQELCRERLGLERGLKFLLFLGKPEDPRKNIRLVKAALEILGDPSVRLLAPYPVPHDQIPLYINAADALTLTSFLEGSPNVVKEAMACNCPVVAADVGDVASVIGKTRGCYICSYDAADVADKLRRVLDSRLRTTGREDIAHLNEKEIAKKLIAIYHSVAPTPEKPDA